MNTIKGTENRTVYMVSITLVLHISIISLLQSNSISQHAIILWWEIKLYLKLMCMCITLGSMYVELNELTAHIFLIKFSLTH